MGLRWGHRCAGYLPISASSMNRQQSKPVVLDDENGGRSRFLISPNSSGWLYVPGIRIGSTGFLGGPSCQAGSLLNVEVVSSIPPRCLLCLRFVFACTNRNCCRRHHGNGVRHDAPPSWAAFNDGMPCSCLPFLACLFPRGPCWGGQSPRRQMNRRMPNSPNTCASAFRHNRWGWTPDRSIDTPILPNIRATQALYYSAHAPPRAWRPSPQQGYITSPPCFTAHWYHTQPGAIDIP